MGSQYGSLPAVAAEEGSLVPFAGLPLREAADKQEQQK